MIILRMMQPRHKGVIRFRSSHNQSQEGTIILALGNAEMYAARVQMLTPIWITVSKCTNCNSGACSIIVVEALCYKLEGHGVQVPMRLLNFFNLANPSNCTEFI
jgi:hypothetical protein